MALKPYQVLTQESIEKIENAIDVLTGFADKYNENVYYAIEDLKAILTDVRE